MVSEKSADQQDWVSFFATWCFHLPTNSYTYIIAMDTMTNLLTPAAHVRVG